MSFQVNKHCDLQMRQEKLKKAFKDLERIKIMLELLLTLKEKEKAESDHFESIQSNL